MLITNSPRTTACTVVNNLGLFRTSEVKINSKRVNRGRFCGPFGFGTFVMTYNPWTLPLNLERTVLMLMEVMQLNPMLRLVLGRLCCAQITRRLVTTKKPLFPLFPLVSSTELMESISNSPLEQAS